MLNEAIEIALQAHYNQLYGNKEPYIIHPICIMLEFIHETERIVAVLHDAIEDSTFTLEDLEDQGFSSEVIEAVDAITKRDNESYIDYVHRCAQNPIARAVKLADLNYNMVHCLYDGNLDRYLKYLFAKAEILNEQDETEESLLDGDRLR